MSGGGSFFSRSIAVFGTVLLARLPVYAQTNGTEEEQFILNPPLPELSPTFFEQYGAWMLVAGIFFLTVLGTAIWFLLRPKPPVVEPIEVETRRELRMLKRLPEDGRTLSWISQILRKYFARAFDLPPGEMTTTEFCDALSRNDKIPPGLATETSDFLRRCDAIKFSAETESPLEGAVARAMELVERAEARRAELRNEASKQP